jgi:hypothetical protein
MARRRDLPIAIDIHRQPPTPIKNFPFSNGWLNFKHPFWAA